MENQNIKSDNDIDKKFLTRGCSQAPQLYQDNKNIFVGRCCKLNAHDWLQNVQLPEDHSLFNCVEVRFKNCRKDFFRIHGDMKFTTGDIVAVEATPGHDIGIVSLTGEIVKLQMLKKGVDPYSPQVKRIYRKARLADIEKWVNTVDLENEATLKSRKMAWDLNLDLATNVLIADSKEERNYQNCVIVNLPAGKPLRFDVNLVDHPENLGKWLKVKGTLRTYFGAAGLRDSSGEASDFELEGGGGGGGTAFFSEDFNTNLGVFTAYSVTGDQVWGWGNFDGGCAVMSGYVQGTNYPNEDWLVSPAISLAGKTGVKIEFREAINYITNISDMKVLISTDYSGSGDPSINGTWTELQGFNRAPGNNWNFVNSGEVSLASYENKTVFIAFKYLSYSSGSATWEVSKVELRD
jgi:hypothetical protein